MGPRPSLMTVRLPGFGVTLAAFNASDAVSPLTITEQATTAKAEMRISSRRGR